MLTRVGATGGKVPYASGMQKVNKGDVAKGERGADRPAAKGDPLARLDAARIACEKSEARELELVEAARDAGVSWARIGALYGLSKQGAQQRFRPKKKPAAASQTESDTPTN